MKYAYRLNDVVIYTKEYDGVKVHFQGIIVAVDNLRPETTYEVGILHAPMPKGWVVNPEMTATNIVSPDDIVGAITHSIMVSNKQD